MKYGFFLLGFLVLMLAAPALNAGQINKVDPTGSQLWVADFAISEFKINDSVCLFQGTTLLGCGVVNALTAQTAGIRITERKVTSFYAGAQVSMRRNTRSPATTETVTDTFEEANKRTVADISLGLSAGFNYFYPNLNFKFAVTRDFAIGLEGVFASYAQGANGVRLFGGYLTGTYYHTHYAFKGLNFEGGFGYFNINATSGASTQSAGPIAAKLTVGWRGRALWGLPLDLGVSAGAQYVFLDTAPLSIGFRGILPLLSVYIAYPF